MPDKRFKHLQDVFSAAGSATKLAAELGLHTRTVERWKRHGVPERYWQEISERTGISVLELHAINERCRGNDGAIRLH